jgi:phosphoribosylpyrophosphate synthetase
MHELLDGCGRWGLRWRDLRPAPRARPAQLLAGAREQLDDEAVREVYVTDSVKVLASDWPKLRVISVAQLFAGALQRVMAAGSLANLF